MKTPEQCPVCGAPVPAGAYACPECGADERSGWNEEATRYDGLDLPDSCFEEEAPAKYGQQQAKRGLGKHRVLIALVAIATLLAFCLTFVL